MPYVFNNEKKPEWVLWDINGLKEDAMINIRIEREKHAKTMEILDLFEPKVEAMDRYCKRLESEIERHNAMLERLSQFIIAHVPVDPAENEDVVDTAIRVIATELGIKLEGKEEATK